MREHVPRELLSALADGECDPTERRWAHDHLAECSSCMEAAREFTIVRGLVGDLPRLVAPASFVADLVEPSGARRAARRVFAGPRKYVAGAAAAVAVAVSLAGLAVPPERPEPPVDMLMSRHVIVNAGNQVGGEVLFAVNGD